MDRRDIIWVGGIILACIWLLVCGLLKPEKRKYAYIIGAVIDLLLFAYCKNSDFFLTGVIGGFLVGLIPDWVSRYKYENAIRELNGKTNLIIMCVIFCTMIFMFVALAYPKIRIDWS